MNTKASEKVSKQQSETLTFFDKKAANWDEKVRGNIANRVNVQQQRNDYVLKVVDEREVTRYSLDIGCGVGDLVIELAERGIQATGIDFASGMIDIAHRRLAESKADMARFMATDYFDWHVENDMYDVISANGFVEYISFEQRDQFFNDAWRGLKPGGSLVVSSRNRLFNLFSLNDFTKKELIDDAVKALLLEALALVDGKPFSELLGMTAAELPDPTIKYSNTGVAVSTRYQYTPLQLMQLVGQAGFDVAGVSPIHVHGVLPSFKNEKPDIHTAIAQKLQPLAIDNLAMLPQASAFMIHAVKPKP